MANPNSYRGSDLGPITPGCIPSSREVVSVIADASAVGTATRETDSSELSSIERKKEDRLARLESNALHVATLLLRLLWRSPYTSLDSLQS